MAHANFQDTPINIPTESDVQTYQEEVESQVKLVHEKVRIHSQSVSIYVNWAVKGIKHVKKYIEILQDYMYLC